MLSVVWEINVLGVRQSSKLTYLFAEASVPVFQLKFLLKASFRLLAHFFSLPAERNICSYCCFAYVVEFDWLVILGIYA
jgi:hypothetical protein